MGAKTMLDRADTLVFETTGKHLNDLQRRILEQVWQRQTYGEMARRLRYTEGHIKDVASQLWQTLSQSLAEPVTKGNCRSVLERRFSSPPPLQPQAASLPHSPAPMAFLGRDGAIADLQALIHQGHRTIVLKGEGGIGKTTLAQQFLEQAGFDQVLELLMAKETTNITPAEQVVEEWLRQDFQIEPGRDFGVTLDRLKRQLRTRRVGILIDNLEPALDSQGRFWTQHSRYGDVLRVLCDPKGQALTLLTSRDRLCEPSITVTHYRLPGLGVETWQDFFAQVEIAISASTLTAMHRAYGGNAKAMTILRGAIQGDFDGEGDAYWQENGTDPLLALDLKNLIASQVNRLKGLDPEAYRLFCRLGAYRYQDVPRLPTEGVLALMWDVDPIRHRQVIMSLRHRSLLESHRGHYWLHPVVQAEALVRLRTTPDWPRSHNQAAQFWTESVTTLTTVAEATHALEAYYHCWAIADYKGAASVLLHSYHNQWGQYLTLGSALYRIGLLQPLRTAITALLPHLPEDQRASELRNILADVHWISGQVHDAITLQEQARAIALHCLETLPEPERRSHSAYCLTMVQVDALLSLGLYHLDLWNLSTATDIFRQVIEIATGTAHQSWADKATLCWALVQSYEAEPKIQTHALAAAEQAYQALTEKARPEDTGRFAFFLQLLGQTYANSGQGQRAADLYEQAIAFAQASHYIQVQAKALVGLGELARQRQAWTEAIAPLQAALGLFEDLGARSDLAETHYQCGLTHQAQGAIEMAQTHFQRAIQLFTEIQAPKQIDKVQAAQQQ